MDSHEAPDTNGAPLWLTFFVALPVPCPVQHGTVISRAFDEELRGCELLEVRPTEQSDPINAGLADRMFASLKFWQLAKSVDHTEHLQGMLQVIHEVTGLGSVSEGIEGVPQETYMTVVEMVTAQNSDTLHDMPNALHEAFHRCFSVLSDVYAMSRLVTRESLPPRIGIEQVQSVTWYGRLPGKGYTQDLGGIFWVSPPSYFPSEMLDEKEFERLEAHLGRIWNGSPLELVMEHALVARQYLDQQGDYANSVIQAALSSEVLLDSLLGIMLWEEQIGSPGTRAAIDIFDEAKGGGLASRIKREYAPRLGGNWNVVVAGPVRKWSEDLAHLRGRVVHRGYRPSRAEAERALEASDALLDFVKSRLAAKAKHYPRTCLMILGEPGLRRLGGWKWVRLFLDATDEHPLRWFSDYSSWRDRVDARQQI
ncbi:hypothetical protein [Streptomyces sp. CS207]|uniref:hypothetical protein n=1 Tax=Streptomyces sp. CS207 TaxID=2162712 RepID=UPI0013A55A0A|nr:hypothetical protein [Streptomyces sp. CS207]